MIPEHLEQGIHVSGRRAQSHVPTHSIPSPSLSILHAQHTKFRSRTCATYRQGPLISPRSLAIPAIRCLISLQMYEICVRHAAGKPVLPRF